MESLLTEIRSLTDEEFHVALADAAGEKPAAAPKKKAAAKPKKLAKDSPVARIAAVVKQQRGLSDYNGQTWLRSALERDGVDPALIPDVSEQASLENWLEVLLKSVRSAVVYDVATSV
ncbi:MAG: hypothetical protein P9E88_05320 [Candidatus Competibacter sp.]|nr:hypothetical protein [Candidatus Competibacter sp.]